MYTSYFGKFGAYRFTSDENCYLEPYLVIIARGFLF